MTVIFTVLLFIGSYYFTEAFWMIPYKNSPKEIKSIDRSFRIMMSIFITIITKDISILSLFFGFLGILKILKISE